MRATETIANTGIEGIYGTFASRNISVIETAVLDGEQEGEAMLIYEIACQTSGGDCFQGNIAIWEDDANDGRAWAEAIGDCLGEYGDLHVFNPYAACYESATESQEYGELACTLTCLCDELMRLAA